MKDAVQKESAQSGATYWYSVRRKIMLGAFTMPVTILLLQAAIAKFAIDWFNEAEADARHQENSFNESVRRLEGVHAETTKHGADVARLKASPREILDRATVLADELSVELENISDSTQSSSGLVQTRPMAGKPSAITLKLSGTPEKLHQFFASLEAAFPALIVMSTSIETRDHRISCATTYLLATYAFTATAP